MSTNDPTPKKPGLGRLFDNRRTQASLFHYIRETPEPSIWSDMDWSFLLHPVRFLKEEWKTPRTRASLFHYIDDEVSEPFSFKEFLRDLIFGSPSPNFIPSVFSADAGGIAVSPAEFRSGRRRATLLSFLVHVTIVALALVLMYRKAEPVPPKDNIVFVTPPFISPFEGDGRDGGGGGGGGKGEKTPPSSGRMPETTRVQFTPPDPSEPQPMIPPDDLTAPLASIVMPIDIPQDTAIPIGDVQAPKNDRASSGPGSGGGIGTGRGTGIGSGIGPGVGPGEGGGMGGGKGGGIGDGVGPYVQGSGLRPPTPLVQPLPAYTEDARKARVEGLVLIQAIVRKDGSVDSFKVLRGLGHGLDESAIQTIATKWRFRPGTMKGEPVDVQCNIEVSFRLY